MKALSIQQPWADRILSGVKTREYRSWSTSYRGLILVHAGKVINKEAWDGDPPETALIRGAILGVVEVIGMEGRRPACAWVLRNPWRLPAPVPCRGQLGLFDLDPNCIPGLDRIIHLPVSIGDRP